MIQQRDVVPVLERIALAFERIADALEPIAKIVLEAVQEETIRTVPAREVQRVAPPPRVMRPRPPRQP